MDKKIFKKSYIMEGVNLYFIRFILGFFKKRFFGEGKVLVKSCDGIGDILVRTELLKMIEDKYGKENVYVMMQKSYVSLGNMLGYKTISYSRENRKKFISRLKKMYELNKSGFSTYINVEFANDITVGNLYIKERIGRKDENWQVSRNNKYYTESYELKSGYVMNQVSRMVKEILKVDLDAKELTPNIRELFEIEENEVVVAVGSTGRDKVCSPKLMAQYLKEIQKYLPEKKILLVGNGDLQFNYAQELLEILENEKIENLVNKTSIKEVFEIVAKSSLFIGFDSGLYNSTFSLRKKAIGLFRNKSGAFIHDENWLKILTPSKVREDILDKEYPNLEINSITVEEFKKALKEVLA
ncbi:MAG: glycosyltransferase family 9 protein [Cetobacterium sp.]|uniref:glycosyltransferase family 9 protein n=1 Tax=Cetobacterium sp. TaxID=2071632 RepID=UPI003F303BC2